jgi:hypothetical protein
MLFPDQRGVNMSGQMWWLPAQAAITTRVVKNWRRPAMRLLRVPKEPPTSAIYVFGHHLQDNQEWSEFLLVV